MTGSLQAALVARIRAQGPLAFSEFCDVALYDPDDGFYATGGAAGRRGDFLTSVEVGPLFGAVIAGALDTWWHELGEPDPFVVVEAAAGRGTLARSVAKAAPECREAMRYVAVERSAALRTLHPAGVETTAAMPAGPFVGVVLANELLDNVTVDLLRWVDRSWHELRVDIAPLGGAFVEVLVPADDRLVVAVAGLIDASRLREGAEVAVQTSAARWLSDAFDTLEQGRVVAFDYAMTTADMSCADRSRWLRTYRGHERGDDPLVAPGTQDITCELAVDQLARVAPPTRDRTQIEFLAAHGIGTLVDEGRRRWHERTGPMDLAALTARSRVHEADALLDPAGLGSFRVLEWERLRS
jgi:SAM-dependent MidA family methyltransferase